MNKAETPINSDLYWLNSDQFINNVSFVLSQCYFQKKEFSHEEILNGNNISLTPFIIEFDKETIVYHPVWQCPHKCKMPE